MERNADDKQGKRLSRAKIKDCGLRGLHHTAAELAKLHLTTYPDDGQVWLRLADALMGLGRHPDARKALRIAATHVPRDRRHLVTFRRGRIQEARFRYVSARRWYELSVALCPEEVVYRVYLGGLMLRTGRLLEAAEFFERSLLEAGDGPVEELLLNHGYALRALGRDEEAEVRFLRALARCHDYEEARIALEDVAWR